MVDEMNFKQKKNEENNIKAFKTILFFTTLGNIKQNQPSAKAMNN